MTDLHEQLPIDLSQLPAYPGRRAAGCPFDPPPTYTQWREQPGVQRATWNGSPVWVISRHEDIVATMTDPRVSAVLRGRLLAAAFDGAEELPPVFPRMDEPDHGRLRRMLVRNFTARQAREMRPHIEQIAGQFLDVIVEKGAPAELVTDYALPIPSLVICQLLGVPYEDREFFQHRSTIAFSLEATQDEHIQALGELFGYMVDLVERKRREPGDDLISDQIREYVEPGHLSTDTLALNGMILLNAGHETTANMISLGLATLLRNPQALARVRDADNPAVVSNAVEELLRYLSIVQGFVVRTATEDMVIGGQPVQAGDGLLLNLPSGNRDPRHFTDPDRFDIERDTHGQLAFGHGPHLCLGMSLARVELEVAFSMILQRLPDLRLAVPFEELTFRDEMATYGVHRLPVTWGPQ